MKGEIDADAPLDYALFQLFPSHDRYEVCVYSSEQIETIASGMLGQLLLHLPQLKDLLSRGSNANFKLEPPKNLDSSQWFTKSTLKRFLHIVGSLDILNTVNSIESEINQLVEARKFHLSLYTKDHSGDGSADNCNLNGVRPNEKDEVEIVSSDASKNELLRAMDLRLTALRGELAAAFNRAAGAPCSSKHVSDMEKLSHHFGAIDLRNTLHKFADQMVQIVILPCDEKSISAINSKNDKVNKTEGDTQLLKPSHSDTPVKYGVSPAKVAQVERQSLTESEESSCSSEDDQPSAERSRTLIRAASPRRSASPMRRVQIGRSGLRRATALTIKSLNYYPARDRTVSYRDATANSSEEEGSEQPPKKSDGNVRRMSVQDAINLFESKQRDQTSDIQKKRSTLDAFAGANKSVLRRWSAGTGENTTIHLPDVVSESSVPVNSDNLEDRECARSSLEAKPESEFISRDNNPVEAAKVDANMDAVEERRSNPIGSQADNLVTQGEENTEKLTASAEWKQQKEAELNQMLTKMMEIKPVRSRNMESDNNRSQDIPHELRGQFYDHFKGKRDEKLRGETTGKQSEKEARFRTMQQSLDHRKTETSPAKINDVGRKSSLAKPQKSHKILSQSANPKKESSKPAVAKKPLPKASSLPSVRKSWPSAPSPRAATGTTTAKTPCGTSSTGTTPTRRKPQPATPSVPRSSPKVERSLPPPKNVKANQNGTRKRMKVVTEKQQQPSTKKGKTAKTKVETTAEDCPTAEAKPSFYSKVTKKSSVVPLESKPFLRKGSGIGPGVGPVFAKTKTSSQPEETLKSPANQIQTQENEMVTETSEPVNQQQKSDLEALETHVDLESGTQLTGQQKCDETVSSEQVTASGDDSFTKVTESALKSEAEEEPVISPKAWVEIEEHQDLPIPLKDSTRQIESAADTVPVAMSSPRVRHSLSQMLLEESSEPDVIEWGNAENPPAIIYQKDEPKGLKRLLKFARKSRADPNITGWSSPSVFSEGEDDVDEYSRAASKKTADNLLRKASIHAKNFGHQNTSLSEGYEKNSAGPEILSVQPNISKFSAQGSSHKLQDQISAAATTTKASRSFFSLSAFRGSKPNETKLR